MPREDLIQFRRGTAAQWTTADPTLASGEMGFETDTNKIKIGDGSTSWVSLSYFTPQETLTLGLAFGDETSDIEVGTDKLTFQMPNFATTLVGVSVNLKTAPTGSVATFDLNEGGTSVLSTKITIDAGETTSETAATPPVISDSSIAANAIMTVDIDGVGSTVAGVAPKLWIYYTKA